MQQNQILVNDIQFAGFSRSKTITPRDRYVEYVNDLYKVYKDQVSQETFYEGDQATYAELGDNLLTNQSNQTLIKNADTIIVAHWSQEFDPDYASFGPYLLYKYGLDCNIFDVCDCGTIAPFYGLKILSDYIKSEKTKYGILLCLEQTTVPRNKQHGDIIPGESGALLLTLNEAVVGATHRNLKLVDVDIFPEGFVLDNISSLYELFVSKFSDKNLDDVLIITRKASTIWKIFANKMNAQDSLVNIDNFKFIEPISGSLSALKSMASLMQNNGLRKYNILIDEDVESMSIAFVLLEVVE